jgi:cell shape-determining protein MreC
LEQLVELKYYVEKKARMDKLDKLSEKQDKLAENENLLKNRLTLISKIQEELKDLDKDNGELKSPVDVPNDARLKKV